MCCDTAIQSSMNKKLVIATIVLSFAAIWWAVMWMSARFSGWTELTFHYKDQNRFIGNKWFGQFAAMRSDWGYGLITVGANTDALYIAAPLAGSWFVHPPLYIPWKEIAISDNTSWTRNVYPIELAFDKAPGIPLRITDTLYKKLTDFRDRANGAAHDD